MRIISLAKFAVFQSFCITNGNLVIYIHNCGVKGAVTDAVTRLIVSYCSLVYMKRVFERTRQHYICAISRNAFVVGLVCFIDIYVFLKERGNTIYAKLWCFY